MRKAIVAACALSLLASACVGTGGADTRTILVDFSHDEFASTLLFNFPKKITVRQGTTLVFRQTWTGEPHTVTGGNLANDKIGQGQSLFTMFIAYESLMAAGVPLPDPDDPPEDVALDEVFRIVEASDEDELPSDFHAGYDALVAEGVDIPERNDPGDFTFADFVETIDAHADEVFEGLPWAFDEENDDLAQNVAQPCYLTEGLPPEEPDQPCTAEQQEQPVFDGSHSYYNSGIIPYEGPGGNEFRVALADDIDPGSYSFYCAVHGFLQATEVEVVARDADVPSEQDVARQARAEISELADPLDRLYRRAVSDGRITLGSGEGAETIEGPFAGLIDPTIEHAMVNEFVPNRLEVRAGEPVTWRLMGLHTISFDVPDYFPIVEFLDDGTVRLNELLDSPAGGAPEPPEQEGPGVVSIDGGTYDGEGFWSTGLIEAGLFGGGPYAEYTLRVSRPGTYRYACLIHPPMVGTLVVAE